MGTVNTLKWSQFASIAKNDMLDNDQKVYFTGKSKSGLCCNVVGEARTFSSKKDLKADSKAMRETLLALAAEKLGVADGANADVFQDIAKKLTGAGLKNSKKLLATPLDKRVISDVVKQVSDVKKKGVYNSVRNETTDKLERVDAQIGAVDEGSIKEYKDKLKALATMAKTEADWDKANLKKKGGKFVYTHDALVKRCHDFACSPKYAEYRKSALLVKDNFDIVYDLADFAKNRKVAGTSAVTGNEGAPKPKRKKPGRIDCRDVSAVITSEKWNPHGKFTVLNAGDGRQHMGTVGSYGFDESVRRSSIPTVGGIFFEEGIIAPNDDGVRLDVCTDERGLGKMHTTNGLFYKCTATNIASQGNGNGTGVGEKVASPKSYYVVDFSMPSLTMRHVASKDTLSNASWSDKSYNRTIESYEPVVQGRLKRTPKQIADFKKILTEVWEKTCYTRDYMPEGRPDELELSSLLSPEESLTPEGVLKPTRAQDLMLMAVFGGEKCQQLLNLFDGNPEGKADALLALAEKGDYKEALMEAVENYKATLKETFANIYDALIEKGIEEIAMSVPGGGWYDNFVGLVCDVISDVAAEKSDKIKTLVINRQSGSGETLTNDANSMCLFNALEKKMAALEQREQQQDAQGAPAAENA